MRRTEQARLVRDLLERMANDMTCAIDEGRVPEHWDGIELRQWIVDRALDAVIIGSMMDRKRLRAYRNDCIVNNL